MYNNSKCMMRKNFSASKCLPYIFSKYTICSRALKTYKWILTNTCRAHKAPKAVCHCFVLHTCTHAHPHTQCACVCVFTCTLIIMNVFLWLPNGFLGYIYFLSCVLQKLFSVKCTLGLVVLLYAEERQHRRRALCDKLISSEEDKF